MPSCIRLHLQSSTGFVKGYQYQSVTNFLLRCSQRPSEPLTKNQYTLQIHITNVLNTIYEKIMRLSSGEVDYQPLNLYVNDQFFVSDHIPSYAENRTMPQPLKILFVSSEVDPFAKTGGLADVAGALPKTLSQLGHDVRVILPRYGSINQNKFKLEDVPSLQNIEVPVGSVVERANVQTSLLDSSGAKVPCYFLQNTKYFGRNELYVDSGTKTDFPDNDERFIFFSRGILEMLRRLDWQPDIIHCNDWQSGLVPSYLKTLYKDDPLLRNAKTVFTIHNIAYQGRFPKHTMEKAGLPWSLFTFDGVEFYGDVNFLKAGMVFADAITTVSKKYAEEICSSAEFGHGLEGVLNYRRNVLSGILNGIDYTVWNPEIDPLTSANYSSKNPKNKLMNKKALQQKFGLPIQETVPLLGVISRLADQKGFDLLGAIVPELVKMNLQMVVLGTGEQKYHELFERMHKQHPQKIGLYLGFNNELAHLIEAGSDMFLMPSRYEPCGLNQMYSLKYGTVPIVRATGGLDDTITAFNPRTKKGTGFKFAPYDAGEFLNTIKRAYDVYQDQKTWKTLMTSGMKKDFSWTASAKKYVTLYRKLLKQ